MQAPLPRSIWMTTRRLVTLAPLILASTVLAGPLQKELTRATRRVRWRLILVALLACWLRWMLARAPNGLIDAFTFPVSLVPCFPVERIASAFAVMLWGGAYVWPEIFGIAPESAESWLRSVLRLLAWTIAAGAAAETWRQLGASNNDS